MSYKILIGQVTPGGNGADNPVPLTTANYDLDAQESTYPLTQYNVVVYDSIKFVSLQVTGLVMLDTAGRPMVGPTDYVYLPCPPFCA